MSNNLIGQLSAHPQTPSRAPGAELVALINERIRPPQPLQAGDVYVRSLRLVSDEVNDHGGRFPREEHECVCDLLIDSPVLIGHDRSRLPVARNFAARCVAEGDRQWVQVWFYWMRGPMGDRLAADIDGGVVKEGSIGFEFRRPQCSICGHDIRTCEHIPGHEYADQSGTKTIAHYEYRDLVRVLETSLVYRGANPDTRLGNDPVFCKLASEWPDPAAGAADSSLPGSSAVYGVVLDCRRAIPGGHRYVIARRDPADSRVCDELVIHSEHNFRVGELICRRNGRWNSVSNRTATATTPMRQRMSWPAFLCGRSRFEGTTS